MKKNLVPARVRKLEIKMILFEDSVSMIRGGV